MSFSGGVFSINTSGQPVVAGTTISASVFNALTADLATGLSTCMLKDGTQTATAGIGFYAGTVSLPGIYLGTDTATGLYRIGLNNNGYAVNGVKLLDLSSALLGITGALTVSSTTTLSGAITYGGVTLANSVTGTGSMVLSASPTFTGTVSAAAITASGAITPSQTSGIIGTTTNNNANAGSVGEYVSSTVAVGSAVSVTTATTTNITSISLTAGDWDVGGVVGFTGDATTNVQNLIGGTTSTSATLGSLGSRFRITYGLAGVNDVFAALEPELPIPVLRYSLAATTTIYLIARSNFTTNTMAAFGYIFARRVR